MRPNYLLLNHLKNFLPLRKYSRLASFADILERLVQHNSASNVFSWQPILYFTTTKKRLQLLFGIEKMGDEITVHGFYRFNSPLKIWHLCLSIIREDFLSTLSSKVSYTDLVTYVTTGASTCKKETAPVQSNDFQ